MKIHAQNSRMTLDCNLRPQECLDKKVKENRPQFFFCLKLGSLFFNFLIQALLKPQIAMSWLAIFSHLLFYNFGPLKSKYLEKSYMVKTLLGCLTVLALKI